MSYGELYVAESIMHRRLQERRQEIGILGLKRRLSTHGGGWLSRQSRMLLWRLGQLLVALGKRLEGYSVPRTLSLKDIG
jgi:hypothetical protein